MLFCTVNTLESNDSWIISEDRLIRIHNDPRTELYVPTETNSPVPLRYFDVTRKTETDLDNVGEGVTQYLLPKGKK